MGLGSGIQDPGSGKNLFRIPDPGVKKAPDPGSGSATLGSRHFLWVICRYREQVCGLTGQDYSFVSNPAKRKFFMSVPRTPDRQGKSRLRGVSHEMFRARRYVTILHCKDPTPKIRNKYSHEGIAPLQSQFLHSCFCERFIYSSDRSAYSAAGK